MFVSDAAMSAWAAAMARRKAAQMTSEERREHARKMAQARWAKRRKIRKAKP